MNFRGDQSDTASTFLNMASDFDNSYSYSSHSYNSLSDIIDKDYITSVNVKT